MEPTCSSFCCRNCNAILRVERAAVSCRRPASIIIIIIMCRTSFVLTESRCRASNKNVQRPIDVVTRLPGDMPSDRFVASRNDCRCSDFRLRAHLPTDVWRFRHFHSAFEFHSAYGRNLRSKSQDNGRKALHIGQSVDASANHQPQDYRSDRPGSKCLRSIYPGSSLLCRQLRLHRYSTRRIPEVAEGTGYGSRINELSI